MHQLIYGLVYESDPKHAVDAAANDVFQPLVDRREVDYFVTFDQPGRGISGKDRWGDLPAASPADSEIGAELIDRGWEATVDEYRSGFDGVEQFFEEHEPHEFWEDGDVHSQYLFNFHRIGQFDGSSTYLYDQDGEGIRDHDHLERVKEGWPDLHDSDPYENLDLYVVPADVHY